MTNNQRKEFLWLFWTKCQFTFLVLFDYSNKLYSWICSFYHLFPPNNCGSLITNCTSKTNKKQEVTGRRSDGRGRRVWTLWTVGWSKGEQVNLASSLAGGWGWDTARAIRNGAVLRFTPWCGSAGVWPTWTSGWRLSHKQSSHRASRRSGSSGAGWGLNADWRPSHIHCTYRAFHQCELSDVE